MLLWKHISPATFIKCVLHVRLLLQKFKITYGVHQNTRIQVIETRKQTFLNTKNRLKDIETSI